MSDEMTVGELRELLEEESEDAIVRIVHQRSWPLQEVLGGVATSLEIVDGEDDEEEAGEDDGEDVPSILYVVADGHPWGRRDSPYGPSGAWDVMRRGR